MCKETDDIKYINKNEQHKASFAQDAAYAGRKKLAEETMMDINED